MKLALVVNDKLNLEIPKSSRFINIALCLVKEDIKVYLLGIEPDRPIADLEESELEVATIPPLDPKAASNKWRIRLFDWVILPWVMAVRLTRINPDCVIIRGCWFGTCLIPLMRVFGKTAIFDFHGYTYKESFIAGKKLRSFYSRWHEYFSLWGANKILAVTSGVRDQLPLKYHSKVLLLSNGINNREFAKELSNTEANKIKKRYHLCPTEKIVGFVGHWEWWMAIEDLLNIPQYLSHVRILIVGEGVNFQKLKTKYSDNQIIFTGKVKHSHVPNLLKLMDVVVMPHKNDSHKSKIPGYFFSRKSVEYLAAGKPIIVADIIGKEAFLKENENALFYKPGDSKDLSLQIQQLIDNPSLYEKISRNNLELAKEFSWENVIRNSGLMDILRHKSKAKYAQ